MKIFDQLTIEVEDKTMTVSLETRKALIDLNLYMKERTKKFNDAMLTYTEGLKKLAEEIEKKGCEPG